MSVQRESADNCHISHQVQHDPKYTMDEAYAYKARFNVYLVLLDNISFEVLIRCENLSKYVFVPLSMHDTHKGVSACTEHGCKITKNILNGLHAVQKFIKTSKDLTVFLRNRLKRV